MNSTMKATCGVLAATMTTSLAAAAGETITVTTLNDTLDFGGAQQVGDLPGPGGLVSFREAVTAANNTAGPQTIHFAIPQSEWWLMPEMALLRLEDGAFSLNDDATTVDFTTQTDFTGDTNPDGWEVGVYGLEPNAWGVAAIFVNGNDCVIKGMGRVMQRGYGVQIIGDNNRVIGCTISGPFYAGVKVGGFNDVDVPQGNVIGGTAPGEGNVLSAGNSGVRVDGYADETTVIGNALSGSFAGVEVRGATQYGVWVRNTRIGGPTPEERNYIYGAGHYGEEGFPVGEQVSIIDAESTLIEGNWIGLNQQGVRPSSQRGPQGVEVRDGVDTVIRNNVIGGIRITGVNHYAGQRFGDGVLVTGESQNTVIEGNLIGFNGAGDGAEPNYRGVTVMQLTGLLYPGAVLIGGADASSANTVAFNEQQGVLIGSLADGVRITGNSIHDNGLLGIDLLGSVGVTPNDAGDGDSGGNGLQNFPVLAAATSDGSSTIVEGTVSTTANTTLTLEFFASVECDPSGHGEGAVFLGSTQVTTDGSGFAEFEATLPAGTGEGEFVTATSIREPSGDTSEFSACVEVVAGGVGTPGDLNGDGAVGGADLAILLGQWGLSGDGGADMNNDGVVNGADLAMLLGFWS